MEAVIEMSDLIEDGLEIGCSPTANRSLIKREKTSFEKAKDLGYNFESEIQEALQYHQVMKDRLWFFKLPDTHAWDTYTNQLRWMVKEALQVHMVESEADAWAKEHISNRFVGPKVPGDFLLCMDGRMVFIECKHFGGPSFDMEGASRITDHQDAYALDIEWQGDGRYFYMIHSGLVDEVFIFTYEARMKAAVWQEERGYGSIKVEELGKLCSMSLEHLPRGSETEWELGKFLSAIKQGEI
jgi:penicillin-binding protein-related factor A (putative recombinase)